MSNWRVGAAPYANCTDCGQGRSAKTLDGEGRCPWCVMTIVLTNPNPYIPLEPL